MLMQTIKNEKSLPHPLKTEDFEEIEKLARQISEDNKKKISISSKENQLNNNQTSLSSRLQNLNSSGDSSDTGQFGWSEISGISIPYLINKNNKWVSKRMAETKLLQGINMIFSTELLLCIKLKIIHATQAQARLLNEINTIHSDNMYGNQPFVENDPLFSLFDAEECAHFMEYFAYVFSKKKIPEKGSCGFIKINNQRCVPFVRIDHKQYLPLFYFDGETSYLDKMAVNLTGWHATYLRVACKVQDINKKYYDLTTIPCVDLDSIKKFFYPDTSFEEVWPEDYSLDNLFRLPNTNYPAEGLQNAIINNDNCDSNISHLMNKNTGQSQSLQTASNNVIINHDCHSNISQQMNQKTGQSQSLQTTTTNEIINHNRDSNLSQLMNQKTGQSHSLPTTSCRAIINHNYNSNLSHLMNQNTGQSRNSQTTSTNTMMNNCESVISQMMNQMTGHSQSLQTLTTNPITNHNLAQLMNQKRRQSQCLQTTTTNAIINPNYISNPSHLMNHMTGQSQSLQTTTTNATINHNCGSNPSHLTNQEIRHSQNLQTTTTNAVINHSSESNLAYQMNQGLPTSCTAPLYKEQNLYQTSKANSTRYERPTPYSYHSTNNSRPSQLATPTHSNRLENRVVENIRNKYTNKLASPNGNETTVPPSVSQADILTRCRVGSTTSNAYYDIVWLERVATLYFHKSPNALRNALQQLRVSIMHPPVETYPKFPRNFGVSASFGAVSLADLREHCHKLKLMMT